MCLEDYLSESKKSLSTQNNCIEGIRNILLPFGYVFVYYSVHMVFQPNRVNCKYTKMRKDDL